MDKIMRVFGVGLGEFKLTLERADYAVGDTIEGRVSFDLDQPLDGQRLSVGLRATRLISTRGQGSSQGKSSSEKRVELVHDFFFDLDGAQEYTTGEYAFEIYIPPEVLEAERRRARAESEADPTLSRGPIEWEVWSKLSIPWQHGPGQRCRIQVSEPSEEAAAVTPAASGIRSIEAAVRSRACPNCGDHDHRPDAVFCCVCGRKL